MDDELETDLEVIRLMPDLELANWADAARRKYPITAKPPDDFIALAVQVEQEMRRRIAAYDVRRVA